jgi:hydrogenase maturation protease
VSAAAAIHVVGVGNPWYGDDGFGCHVVRRLRESSVLPPSVALFDAGVAGLNAIPCFEGCAKAVLVDAVRVGAPVGSVHRLIARDLEPPGGELSLHELGPAALFAAVSATSRHAPETVLIGAQVARIDTFSEALSAPLRSALPIAVGMVIDECRPVVAGR